LLSNAVKFTPEGGSIEVQLWHAESHVELSVADSGIGIDSEFLPFVFDRFRQADAGTARMHGGLGVGLAIVKQLVDLHGGTVHAQSEGRGRGATFLVRLPRLHVGDQAAATEADPTLSGIATVATDLGGVRVLLVDDDVQALELMKRILNQANAQVSSCMSAAEAVRRLAEEHFDVLISDIAMPQMDGYQLVRTIRETLQVDSQELPAIALTAHARWENRTKAMLAGYQMHIAKPIEPPELLATIANIVGRAPTSIE
jgi:CheY-like chemotaxis protein